MPVEPLDGEQPDFPGGVGVEETDLRYRLSGGEANVSPLASLGGAMSLTEIVSGTLGNLFRDLSAAEVATGVVLYRGFYLWNGSGTHALVEAALWLKSQIAAGGSLALAVALEGVSAPIEALASEFTAPAGVTFSAPVTQETGLAIPRLEPGDFIGLWARLTVPADPVGFGLALPPAVQLDGGVLRVEGRSEEAEIS